MVRVYSLVLELEDLRVIAMRQPRTGHRRGSRRAMFLRRMRVTRALQRDNRRELADDLRKWINASATRRQLAAVAAERGESVEAQAAALGLPFDKRMHARHRDCAQYIAKGGLRRGVPPWMRESHVGPVGSWREYELASGMPGGATQRAVISDSLSFPLTAAHALRLAGVSAIDGRLSLLVLGPEIGAELSGRLKWGELLGEAHGLGARELWVCFCGPLVPRALDGVTRRLRTRTGDLHFAFFRGMWHDAHVRLHTHPAPQIALAFNSGLAEHAQGWLPTLRRLFWARRVPLALTSYHAAEAELDARTLVVRLGLPARVMTCMPNPFASRLPHLDEVMPGQPYYANGFLSVCVPER